MDITAPGPGPVVAPVGAGSERAKARRETLRLLRRRP
jgi:hypothetical protein